LRFDHRSGRLIWIQPLFTTKPQFDPGLRSSQSENTAIRGSSSAGWTWTGSGAAGGFTEARAQPAKTLVKTRKTDKNDIFTDPLRPK
jgi:hypothetical protein